VHGHRLLCSLLAWSAADDLALRTTVVATALADLGRHRLADTRNRSGWRAEYGQLLEMAVGLASKRQESALLVEVIELARSQGLPASVPADSVLPSAQNAALGGAQPSESDDRLKVDIPVVPGRRIAVGGVSRFAAIDAVSAAFSDRAAGLAAGPPGVVDLMAWAKELAGHDTPWVWGWWDVDGAHVWYVARHRADAGEVEVLHDGAWAQRTAAGPSGLGAFSAAMQQEDESLETFVARSALTRSLASERDLLGWLGQELIPSPIRTEVLRRVACDEPPLPLVVLPSPECSRVPLAALAVGQPRQPTSMVPTADGSLDPCRLVEGARLHLAPGVQFTATVRSKHGDRWRRQEPNGNVRAVVASQPGLSNCLPSAGRSVPSDADRLADDEAPSLAAVVKDLEGVVAGSAGVLQFSGHAVAGNRETPGAAHLLLHDGQDDPRERLYAADLLTGRFPRVGLPRCVVLSACSTWGDQGAADWLGLAPALMWNGAQHVVATLWPVLDSPESAAHHCDLVSALAKADQRSPVDVIRELQLAELARQRRTMPPHARYRVRPEDLHGFASGFDWASYAVVTVGAVPA
jgi:hypothetical protein